MEVIELSGSYSEIGEKWGHATKDDLHLTVGAEISGLAQFFEMDKQALISKASLLLPIAKDYDPDFIEVLKGLAKGAEISFNEIFTLRSLLELTFFIHKMPAMCTAFAVGGNATKDGQTIVGQNIDWHPGIPVTMLKIAWPTGIKQLSLSLGGIWEYSLSSPASSSPFGIAATATVAYTDNQNINKVPLSIVMSKAARQKRMEAALSIFINAKKDLGSFLMASGEGDMLGIECVADDVEIHYPEQDALVRANHYLTDRFKPNDFFSSLVPNSYIRHARLVRLIQDNHGKLTSQMLMTFLADHNGFPKSVCTHVDSDSELPPSVTLASIIMVPEERTMYVANGNPCETDYEKHSIDR
jgi:isopenicillin-N N-acyltransferase-like protein